MENIWKNRIIATGEERPMKLLAMGNRKNYRKHPKIQADAVKDILNEVGWVQDIIVNRTSGKIIDGHLRVKLAAENNMPLIPVKYVELDEREENIVLALLDASTGLAQTDADKLDFLMKSITEANETISNKIMNDNGVGKMMSSIAKENEIDLGIKKKKAESPISQSDDEEQERNISCICPVCGIKH